MKVRVSDIRVSDRLRRGAGDIGGLAASIEEIGLLNPVLVTEDFQLVAGFRRLSAVSFLGWEEVEVRVLDDPENQLKAEIHENEFRGDFSLSEIYEAGKRLELIFAQQGTSGRLRDAVARHLRMGSGRSWSRLKDIMESGDEDLIALVVSGELKIGQAHNKLVRRRKPTELVVENSSVCVDGHSILVDTKRGRGLYLVRLVIDRAKDIPLGIAPAVPIRCMAVVWEFPTKDEAIVWAQWLAEILETGE